MSSLRLKLLTTFVGEPDTTASMWVSSTSAEALDSYLYAISIHRLNPALGTGSNGGVDLVLPTRHGKRSCPILNINCDTREFPCMTSGVGHLAKKARGPDTCLGGGQQRVQKNCPSHLSAASYEYILGPSQIVTTSKQER
eukprot:scaffold422057_cov26-Prasinocladus_malaysianus.AAC.1